MKIDSSSIAMGASRTFRQTSISSITSGIRSSTGSNGNSDSASLSLSQQGRKQSSLLLRQKLRALDDENVNSSIGLLSTDSKDNSDQQIKMLKKLLEALKEARNEQKGNKNKMTDTGYSRLNDPLKMLLSNKGISWNLSSGDTASPATPGEWVRETRVSTFFSEQEVTAFSTVGIAKTTDGREIHFGLSLEMSRSFTEEMEMVSTSSATAMTDPLVINLDSSHATVTDQKFYFDLNSDGVEESISFAGQGSGFLALDANGDGTINNGNELFGTRSGDGFADLAAYDEDSNGWIDENDAVFSQLKIWTKDSEGNDKLTALLDADVGAIYLGNVDTKFSLNDNTTNLTQAQIQKTGIYLKESGTVGTIQHVDLAL